MLRRIFVRLPRAVMLASARGCCRTWRDVIDDPTFLPLCKAYHFLCGAPASLDLPTEVPLVRIGEHVEAPPSKGPENPLAIDEWLAGTCVHTLLCHLTLCRVDTAGLATVSKTKEAT